MGSLLSVMLKNLRRSGQRHTPLGLFGSFVLTVFICQIIHIGTQNIWRLLYTLRYFDNDRVADFIYQYRYDVSKNPYAIYEGGSSLKDRENIEYVNQSADSLDKRIHRYGPELAQPVTNTINICSNNSVDVPDVKVTISGDYVTVICGLAFIFSPVFNIEGFGRAMVGILVLPKEYHWIFASTDDVEGFPEYGLTPVEVELQRKSVIEWLGASNGVIAAGAASYEGFLEEEEERADIRSEEVYASLLDVLAEYRMAKILFKLNLGKYDGDSCNHNFYASSSYQRPVIVMGIFTDNDDNDFISQRQAQRGVDRINNKPPIEDIDFSCYSSFPNFIVDINLRSRESLIQRAF